MSGAAVESRSKGSPESQAEWFLRQGDSHVPVRNLEVLVAWCRWGRVSPLDEVRQAADTEWRRANSVGALAQVFDEKANAALRIMLRVIVGGALLFVLTITTCVASHVFSERRREATVRRDQLQRRAAEQLEKDRVARLQREAASVMESAQKELRNGDPRAAMALLDGEYATLKNTSGLEPERAKALELKGAALAMSDDLVGAKLAFIESFGILPAMPTSDLTFSIVAERVRADAARDFTLQRRQLYLERARHVVDALSGITDPSELKYIPPSEVRAYLERLKRAFDELPSAYHAYRFKDVPDEYVELDSAIKEAYLAFEGACASGKRATAAAQNHDSDTAELTAASGRVWKAFHARVYSLVDMLESESTQLVRDQQTAEREHASAEP